jgi:hypothetical protein
MGAAHEWFDAFDEFVTGVDIDACIAIGKALRLVHELRCCLE